MSNEMTAEKAAERIEAIATNASGIEPDKCGKSKIVDVTIHIPDDIKALRYTASLCRCVAAGKLAWVVYCRECEYYHPNNGTEYRCDRPDGRFPKIAITKNGYCSFGKQKTKGKKVINI